MKNSITILLDRCFECGSTENIEYHHVGPKSKGGTQMIPLCLSCHTKVHGEHMLKLRKLANDSRNRMIKECKEKGIPNNLGRKEGYRETMDTFMNKPKNVIIIGLLKEKKYTVRDIIKMSKSSSGTVMKIKKIIES
jgi:hypothetical protein